MIQKNNRKNENVGQFAYEIDVSDESETTLMGPVDLLVASSVVLAAQVECGVYHIDHLNRIITNHIEDVEWPPNTDTRFNLDHLAIDISNITNEFHPNTPPIRTFDAKIRAAVYANTRGVADLIEKIVKETIPYLPSMVIQYIIISPSCLSVTEVKTIMPTTTKEST